MLLQLQSVPCHHVGITAAPLIACSAAQKRPMVSMHPQSQRHMSHGAAVEHGVTAKQHWPSRAVIAHAAGVHTPGRVRSDMSADFPDAPFANTPLFDWFDQWYPVGFVKDFDPAVPHRFVLLGIPLVIWYQPEAETSSSSSSSSNEGSWRVFADVCPHRLVPLSEGRITPQGNLECPYHGWTFNGQGSCVAIPQSGHLATPRACATAYPSVVRQGLLLVKPKALPRRPLAADPGMHARCATSSTAQHSSSSSMGAQQGSHGSAAAAAAAEPYAGVPIVPEFDDPSWLVQDTWRDVPYDWSSLLENVLDASHVPFTHHKSISNRNTVGAYDMKLTSHPTVAGFAGDWPTGPRAGALGPQETLFRPPCYMAHKIRAEKRGYESMVVVYAVPIGPGKCRLLNRNAFKFTGGGVAAKLPALLMKAVPGWAIHIGTQVPLEDDQIFLHLGEAEYVKARASGKSAAQAYYMPSPADTYVIAFRQWIRQFGMGGPFGDVGRPEYSQQLGSRLSTPQLLDRYAQHTANCAQCQAALKQVQGLRRLVAWAAGISASLALLTAAGALATVGVTQSAAAAGSVAGATAGGVTAAAAATGFSGKVAAVLLSLAAQVANFVLPAGASARAGGVLPDVSAQVAAAAGVRVAGWLAAAVAAGGVHSWLGGVQQAFYTGQYPPPRNLDRK